MRATGILVVIVLAGCMAPVDLEQETGDRVRFIAWGDMGAGTEAQQRTADAALEVCRERGCDLVVGLGDLVYESGVSGVHDPLFESHFEEPYADWDIPFYQALGNHDHRNGAQGVQAMVAYEGSGKWRMPAPFYTFAAGPAAFFVLDTTPMVEGETESQQAWLDAATADATAPVQIVLGHHPYVSNGVHGDAGSYEGVPGDGAGVRDVLDAEVCGQADLYLAGHDHDLQWLQAGPCGDTELVISGAAARTRPIVGDHPAHFQRGDALGFFWFDATAGNVTGIAFDAQGQALFERSFVP